MSSFCQSDPSQPQESDNPPAQLYHQPNISVEAQALSSANLARWFDLDSDNSAPGPKGAARVRRRAPPDSDHIKHRRTRSGCYTCRSRRVKVRPAPSAGVTLRLHSMSASVMKPIPFARVGLSPRPCMSKQGAKQW